MKYKVGDKVRIKSLDWYNANKDEEGKVDVPKVFTKEMSKYCGKETTVLFSREDWYDLDIDSGACFWTDEMLEETVDKIKLPLNIGDRVLVNNKITGTIVAYYFGYAFNDYSEISRYGYTIKTDGCMGHSGKECSYNEYGERINPNSNNCWYYSPEFDSIELVNNSNSNMKKSDLKPGMVVETRKGRKYLCTEVNGSLVGLGINYFLSLESQNEDLSYCDEEFSIIKVYRIKSRWNLSSILDDGRGLELIWEKPKQVELTMEDIADKFGIPVEQLKIKK